MANSKRSVYLTDEEIIALYWKRNERAIEETDAKYHGYLHTVAYNILHDDLDCEECLNDTYLGTWNAIPPARPSVFQIFLSKILRNTAVNRYKRNHATKRIPSEMTVSLEELEPYFAYREYTSTVEADYETYQLSLLLSRYLRSLTEKQSFIFICRYYCCDRIADIADMLHVSERTVFRTLKTIQQGLKALLEKEGYRYE
jgi:RNA polymerase sigma-70 factor (ECF subfamily)